MAVATIYDPYGNVLYSYNTPSGGGPGGGAVDPTRDYVWLGNHLWKGSHALAPGALFQESANDGVTAHAGGGQTNAFQITSEVTRIATVATANDSVQLPPSQAGLTLEIVNHGANPMQVFGNTAEGATIDDIATATGVSQMANSAVKYWCATPGKWYSQDLSTGFSTSLGLQTLSYVDGLVAHAGGGQGSATALTKLINRVSTVATAGDSVILPASTAGLSIQVYNGAAANAMNVFPAVGEAINALGANTAFSQAAVTLTIFTCVTAGTWFTK